MKRCLLAVWSSVSGIGFAAPAKAFFDTQFLGGARWYVVEGEPGEDATKVGASEYDLTLHASPIDGVPVALGFSAQAVTMKKADLDATKAELFQAGVDVMAWVPRVPVLTPYLRISTPVRGHLNTEYLEDDGAGSERKTEITQKVTGYRAGLGFKFELLPVLEVLLQYGLGREKLETTSAKVDGVETSAAEGKKYDLASNAVLVGVEMGL